MVTENVSTTAQTQLKIYFNNVYVISTIKSINTDQLKLLNRLDLDVTYSKLHVFDPDVIPYAKVAFLDADVLVLKNIDEIFDHVGDGKVFGAAPDIGWPDCFNSGVFVALPSKELFDGLVEQTKTVSFDGIFN
jgi:alpha-N-acetylglucosamine transferase